MNMDEKIRRINELYHKSQAEGLTAEEKEEQAKLRREYVESIRGNLRSQLDSMTIQYEDGSREKVSDRRRRVEGEKRLEEEEKKLAEMVEGMLKILKEHSIELEENTTLFFRHDENVMVENAVDGIFVPHLPFTVSSNPKCGEGLKYTNILLMPKSKKILPLGPDAEMDIVIAPGTEFKLQDTLDGTQNLWMCGDQPFYDEK